MAREGKEQVQDDESVTDQRQFFKVTSGFVDYLRTLFLLNVLLKFYKFNRHCADCTVRDNGRII